MSKISELSDGGALQSTDYLIAVRSGGNVKVQLSELPSGIGAGGNIVFGDNEKAIFGAGSDLQIYHDASNSYIIDNGTGSLFIRGNSQIQLQDTNTAGKFFVGTAGGAATLYHNNAAKLATTATGIDVTGTVTADGLTVDGFGQIRSNLPYLYLVENDTTDLNTGFRGGDGQLQIRTFADNLSTSTTRFAINHSTGDISFYEDTGTTPKFFWDASAESLGIGTTSPSSPLHISDSGNSVQLRMQRDASNYWGLQLTGGNLNFQDIGSSTTPVSITSAGNVGIGTSSPGELLHLEVPAVGTSSGEVAIRMSVPSDIISAQNEIRSGVTSGTNPYISFAVRETSSPFATVERMRITSGGNVGIGTSTPATALDVNGTVTADGLTVDGDITFDTEGDKLLFETSNALLTPSIYADDDGIGNSLKITADNGVLVRIDERDAGSGGFFVQNGSTHKNAVFVNNNGDISFYEDTGTTPKLTWSASNESLTVPTLVISDGAITTTAAAGDHTVFNSTGADADFRVRTGANTHSLYVEGNTGNVGIGTNSPSATLDVENSAVGTIAEFRSNTANGQKLQLNSTSTGVQIASGFDTGISGSFDIRSGGGNSYITMSPTGSEAMRIDSSGNLLVGKTSSNPNIQGVQAYSSGLLALSKDSGRPLYINRNTTDGELIDFVKDGTTVGSIGTASSGDLYIADGRDAGLKLDGGNNQILPVTSAGAQLDNTLDLGKADTRFKDLYLSGGVYLGGTGAANKLEDYETGTFTASTLTGETSGSVTIQSTLDTLAYTKVGRLVTITGRLRVSSASSPVGDYVTLTLPFTSSQLVEEAGYAGGCSIYSDDGSATWNAMPCRVQENTTTMELYLPLASIDSDYRLEFNFSYLTG